MLQGLNDYRFINRLTALPGFSPVCRLLKTTDTCKIIRCLAEGDFVKTLMVCIYTIRRRYIFS